MIRDFPYPFASALTIVSDVDGSSKARYEGYVGDIVYKLGLDFGDSTWLRTSCDTPSGTPPIAIGLGFFSRHFGIGKIEPEQIFARTRTFTESLSEYHVGNLDHFHAFVSRGPRVAVLERGQMTSDGLVFELGAKEMEGFWKSSDIFIEAICVVVNKSTELAIHAIVIAEHNGKTTRYDREVSAPSSDGGEQKVMLVVAATAEDDCPHPRLDEIVKVSVVLGAHAEARDILRLLLVSGSNAILLDRLKLLRESFNVETSLVTEHSALHFRSAVMAARRDAQQDEYIANHPHTVAPLNGSRRAADGHLVFSTDGDEPQSVARMLPELATDLEVRYLVPQAATSSTGWSVDKMIRPLATRSGTMVYQVHRTLPNLTEPENKAAFDGTFSRQENFVARLAKVLDASNGQPGLYWPIYTHLGGITIPIADRALPSPYFEGDALNRLQDRTYNISGSVPGDARIWMARSSTFYDYALIRRSIASHVVARDENTIEISSWQDEVLNKTLPRSASQLYGLTFYIDDPERAKVLLDGRPIEQLARNGRDETGQHSVTICEAEIRHLVFDTLDPLQRAGLEAELSGGTWRFFRAVRGKSAYGQLTVSRGQSARLRIPMHGWRAVGSQLLSMIARRSRSGNLGVTLETVEGGRFFFGDRELLDTIEPVTASYIFEYDRGGGLRAMASPQMRTMVAPFHCMAWTQGSTGGPMPSHPLAWITLHCSGGRGAYADFGKLMLLRPRTTSLNHGDVRTYCLGGFIPGFKPGQIASAQAKGKSGMISAVVDQRGLFCFTGLPEGIYNVWTESEGGRIYDRRGALVELRSDLMTLELSRNGVSA